MTTVRRAMLRIGGALALMAAAATSGGASGPTDLDALVSFKSQGLCETTPAFEALIRASHRTTGGDGSVIARQPAVASRYRAAFGKVREKRDADWTSIVLPLRNARWGGLPITELALHFPVGGDPAHISLQFRATIAQVRKALAAKRMRVGSADDGVYAVEMTVTRLPDDPSSVVLACGAA